MTKINRTVLNNAVPMVWKFSEGGTVRTVLDLFANAKGLYQYTGTLPHSVAAGYVPSTGDGWNLVFDKSTLNGLGTSEGASTIGTAEGNLQDALYLAAHAVRLSRFMQEPEPLESALQEARRKNLPLIIDTDCEYSTFVVKANDKIIGYGQHTLTKRGNDVPNLPKNQNPDRPVGYLSDFNVDAGIVVYHEDGASAQNILLQGFKIESKSHSRYGIYAPSISISTIERVSQLNFLTGIRFFAAYLMTVRDFMSLYWYSDTDVFADSICYDISDGNYSSGTSLVFEKVYCTNYKQCFYVANLEYSTWTNCGGEGVDSHNPPTQYNMPRVFEFVNCTNLVLNTPSTENLWGSFLRITSTQASTVTVNNPQAITGVYGTRIDVKECKLVDIQGQVQCTLNGGVMTGAAIGHFLKFGGAKGSSSLIMSGTDLRFCLEEIRKDTEVYDGLCSYRGYESVECFRYGLNNPQGINAVCDWKLTGADYYGMSKGSRIKILFGGMYTVNVQVPVTGGTSGSILLKIADTETGDGSDKAVQYISSSSDRKVVNLQYRGRIPSGKYLYVTGVNTEFSSVWDPDASIRVVLDT